MLDFGENPILRIAGVEHMVWAGTSVSVKSRPYSALAYRIRGEAQLSSSGQQCAVHPEQVLYLPQELDYCAEYTDTEILVLHFVTAKPDRRMEVFPTDGSGEIPRLFAQALRVWQSREPGSTVELMAIAYRLAAQLLESQKRGSLPPRFRTAVLRLNSGFRNGQLTVRALCEQSGIGETEFRRLFRTYYQKTPVQYLTELRLEYARSLIAAGTPVEQAAYESGFSDPKYFSRVVKKHLGCTPRELRSYGK